MRRSGRGREGGGKEKEEDEKGERWRGRKGRRKNGALITSISMGSITLLPSFTNLLARCLSRLLSCLLARLDKSMCSYMACAEIEHHAGNNIKIRMQVRDR